MTDLAEVLRQHQERAGVLLAAFDAADGKTRERVKLADFRCKVRGCSLLVAWQASGVRLVRLPNYKLSRVRNDADTVPSAREKRTTDGDRHWQARVMVLDELVGWPGVVFDLKCDHVDAVVSVSDLLAACAGVTPGAPLRRVYPR